MSGRLRQSVAVLLKLGDSPHRTALAFGIGVWIAFFPVLGIHTLLALLLAFLLRLNRVPILLGAFINNPWTLAPMFMAGTALGCLLLGVSPTELAAFDWSSVGEHHPMAVWESLRPLVLPYLLGNLALGTLCGFVAYGILRRLLGRQARGPEVGSAGSGAGPQAQPQ
jgi:uncharacterized protein (DUF2062 family)